MSRGTKAAYNSTTSLIAEGISIICGFILPRLILSNFGSSYNGLIQSVAQFLSVIALLRSGIGGATRAALYRSIASKDKKQIDSIIRATEIFMRKVAMVFAAFAIVFSFIYPLVIKNDFNYLFSVTLILIISASTVFEYYFATTYIILLEADQRQYIISLYSAFTTILNTVLSVAFIKLGFGIHVVKLGTALAFSFSSVLLYTYASKRYNVDKKAKPDYSSINQRWDALFHQVAGFVYSNTDIILITLFISLKEVSVYTTYCLVSYGLKKLTTTVTTGVEAAFGDMLAREDQKVLYENVKLYETVLHSSVCILYGAALVLITPFIEVYTRGITDVNYSRTHFGYLLIITEMVHLLRQPYHSITEAAGHFRQTKHIPIIQAVLNLGLSLALIKSYGIIGVMIGTLSSDLYRGVAYRLYVKKHILPQIKGTDFVKRYVVTIITVLIIFLCSNIAPRIQVYNYMDWALFAFIITIGTIAVTLGLDLVFFNKEMLVLRKKISIIIKSIIRKNR